MDVHVDWRVWLSREVGVELLAGGGTVRKSFWRSQPRERCRIPLGDASGDIRLIRRPWRLVVRGVELLLVVIEKYERTFRPRRYSGRHVRLHLLAGLQRMCGCRDANAKRAAEPCATRDISPVLQGGPGAHRTTRSSGIRSPR